MASPLGSYPLPLSSAILLRAPQLSSYHLGPVLTGPLTRPLPFSQSDFPILLPFFLASYTFLLGRVCRLLRVPTSKELLDSSQDLEVVFIIAGLLFQGRHQAHLWVLTAPWQYLGFLPFSFSVLAIFPLVLISSLLNLCPPKELCKIIPSFRKC